MRACTFPVRTGRGHGFHTLHTLEAATATEGSRDYTLVIKSLEASPTGWFTINYPEFPGLPQNLELNRQAIQGVLDDFSNFDGNFYSKGYQIFGAFASDTVTV